MEAIDSQALIESDLPEGPIEALHFEATTESVAEARLKSWPRRNRPRKVGHCPGNPRGSAGHGNSGITLIRSRAGFSAS